MTPINLIKALSEEIKYAVSEYTLEAELQSAKSVSVYEQYMPVENFEDDTFYPAVIVSLQRLEDDGSDSVATLTITIGVYKYWQDLLNIAERIRQRLLSRSVVGKRFIQVMPMEFEPLTDQPEPFYFGTIVVKYRVGTMRR